MTGRSPRASYAPPSQPLAEDKIALLPSSTRSSTAELRASDGDYQGILSNLPGARKLAPTSRSRLRSCALPPPRITFPLLFALALLASGTLLLMESTRTKLSQYLIFSREQSLRIRDAFFQPPSWPLDASGVGILEAEDGTHTVTAIVIHGLGDKGDGSPWTWALADRFPFVRWVAPTADYLNVTVHEGATTRAWFDIADFGDIWKEEDIVGYMHSQQQLNQLIDEERQIMIDAGQEPRIVLLGFSQGGAMALLATLTAPRPDRIEAAAVMGTYLPLVDSFDDIFQPAARDIPLLWLHGLADPFLTYANAELSVARLTTAPISLSHLAFSGYDHVQHSWNGDMLADVAAWFAENVPEHRNGSGGRVAGGTDLALNADLRDGGKEVEHRNTAQLGVGEEVLRQDGSPYDLGLEGDGPLPAEDAAMSDSSSGRDGSTSNPAIPDRLYLAEDLVPARSRRRAKRARSFGDLLLEARAR